MKRLVASTNNDMYNFLINQYGYDFCIDGKDFKVYSYDEMYEQAEYSLYNELFYSHKYKDPQELLDDWYKNAFNYNLYVDSAKVKQLLNYDIYFIYDIIQANNFDENQIDLPYIYYDEFKQKQANLKRLRKQAVDVNMLSSNIFNNLGQDGRKLLKQIEEYKYSIVQQKELVQDEKSQKQIQKCIDDLDNVSAFIYNFVYDLENYEVVDDYDKRIEFNVPDNAEEDIEVEQPEETETNEEVVDEDNAEDNTEDEDMAELFDSANENDEMLDEEE